MRMNVLAGFSIGFTLAAMMSVAIPDVFVSDPWQVPGENRGQAEKRVERKMNERWAKLRFLRYRLVRCSGGLFDPDKPLDCDCDQNGIEDGIEELLGPTPVFESAQSEQPK